MAAITSIKGDDCSICLESLRSSDRVRVLHKEKSDHEFHFSCIRKWIQLGHRDCPLCRQKIIRIIKLEAPVAKPVKAAPKASTPVEDREIIQSVDDRDLTKTRRLLESGVSASGRSRAFVQAVALLRTDIALEILQHGFITISAQGNALILAAELGWAGLASQLLLGAIDPYYLNKAVIGAAEKNRLHILETLLKHRPIEPETRDKAVIAATVSHHPKIVRCLLLDGAISESCQRLSWHEAIKSGDREIAADLTEIAVVA